MSENRRTKNVCHDFPEPKVKTIVFLLIWSDLKLWTDYFISQLRKKIILNNSKNYLNPSSSENRIFCLSVLLCRWSNNRLIISALLERKMWFCSFLKSSSGHLAWFLLLACWGFVSHFIWSRVTVLILSLGLFKIWHDWLHHVVEISKNSTPSWDVALLGFHRRRLDSFCLCQSVSAPSGISVILGWGSGDTHTHGCLHLFPASLCLSFPLLLFTL